ncbi:hypothetical protein JRG18_11455 [Kocuria palustris]|uniref:hypothetical protein n=1 Tax=Kocuria palustris TaxID=71999 RepID=UPI00045E9170|nr:hypothetical protein [Kocuria palustris]MBN6753497.1 hypothetical protein [Kocuria palustris]MBN6759078.1 hypothetical protein [Kocuria palustris]MBN6763591.1 hypothetical protein [Kocuria palustris]MBN6783002.1 hypothetical protein [Kocuria palustris]MBN6799520.1 hypothetical protein [Kocuria palustris]
MPTNALTAAHTAATLGLAPLPADIKHAADEKQQIAARRDEAHQAGQTAQVDYERALADGDPAKASTSWAKVQALRLDQIGPVFSRLTAAADAQAQAAAQDYLVQIAPKAREAFNKAATAFTTAYDELGGSRLSPASLIRNERSAQLWRELTTAAEALDGHALVIDAAAAAGAGLDPADRGEEAEDRMTRYAAGLAHVWALRNVEANTDLDWLRNADLAPVARWLRILHAQGRHGRPTLKALDPDEQRHEIAQLRSIAQAWSNGNGGAIATIATFAPRFWAQKKH